LITAENIRSEILDQRDLVLSMMHALTVGIPKAQFVGAPIFQNDSINIFS